MAQLLEGPPLVVQECTLLKVPAPLHFVLMMYVLPLELHHVCGGGLERGLQFVLCIPTRFHQFVRIVPQDWDKVTLPLNPQHIERRNQYNT